MNVPTLLDRQVRVVHDDEWIVRIDDVTPLARGTGSLVAGGRLEEARRLLPAERPLALPGHAAASVGASSESR
jgi:hypothetical protein